MADREQTLRDAETALSFQQAHLTINGTWSGAMLANHCLTLLAELEQAEARLAKVRALVEAIASALTSLGTGPLKDGYAAAVLTDALAALEEPGARPSRCSAFLYA